MQQTNETPQNKKDYNHSLSRMSLSSLFLSIGAALLFGVIYLILPTRLTLIPGWIPLAVEVILLLPIVIAFLVQRPLPYRTTRILISIVISMITLALMTGVFLLIKTLPGRQETQGGGLLRDGALLYISNILIFGLWYWEIDGGGPKKRHMAGHQAADFLFPQQNNGNPSGWEPHFIDYIFVAFTTSTALSPADTLPLTRSAKCLMMIQAIISLIILAILIGRAINIL